MGAGVWGGRVIVIALALLILIIPTLGGSSGARAKSAEASPAPAGASLKAKEGTYTRYAEKNRERTRPEASIRLEGEQYTLANGMEAVVVSEEGTISVRTEEQGELSWEVDIAEEGLYHIALRYYPVSGRNESIERRLLLNGQSPFAEAERLLFPRIWGSEADEFERDKAGNDLRPSQVEKPEWREMLLQDAEGYVEEPFAVYFPRGKQVITLESVRESMLIDYLELRHAKPVPTYAEWEAEFEEKGYRKQEGVTIKVQGEQTLYTSSPMLYPQSDRSSPATEPQKLGSIRLNTIGGNNWRIPGQSITWAIDVPQDGLYRIAFKYRQNLVQHQQVPRKLTIDGRLPFQEAGRIMFKPDNGWKMMEAGDGEEPYWFYLTKGEHRLSLEVTLGDMKPIMSEVESTILELNALYRKVLMITGASPDQYRDYELTKKIPELKGTYQDNSDKLWAAVKLMEQRYGGRGERTSVLQTVAFQLDDLAADPESIIKRLTAFKNNIVALGTWLLTATELPLEIDYIVIASEDSKLPRGDVSWWAKLWYEMLSFFTSFFTDYESVGASAIEGEAVDVWITGGRDQAGIIKRMIDAEFTPQTGISVNLQLVDPAVVLPATLAGSGPDVALQTAEVVNYAMRSALQDLSQFASFQEVSGRFADSAFVPFRYEGGVYAVPEQQTFPMLFYRKDILEELGLDVPQTWEDIYRIIPVLNKHQMNIGLTPKDTMDILLYQEGGSYYLNGGISSGLGTEEAQKAFKEWTNLYTNYKTPEVFDFPNRFRVGEMPIGIADYSTYNTLVVFAPEIRGLWGFAPVPGMQGDDGVIRREAASKSTGAVMFRSADHKENAWAFIDWWTTKQSQLTYGRELEAIMGASARYPTANLEALAELPWPPQDIQSLQQQLEWVRGIPDVPGGYFTERHLNNAFFRVINTNDNPRETLKEYVRTINQEITVKRREFDLPTAE
ncbi:extracellular solute-binding protein [Paenibacillus sp. J5C_2022]|uniref:extracellular solute-binding protein n=1 Tax=Paenibacillus sp. J5C2022 TaxID=2977129 RepID=UPI0021D32769|nr:extracellular solute-binding protein [Paenibacillus sp. J5C2022]MCU6711138.1 extracellular solute-binding protein [Paenibacillus sp. J5C2022]